MDTDSTHTSTLSSTAGEPMTALSTTAALPSATTPALSFPHVGKSSNIDSTISSTAGMSTAALLALAQSSNRVPTATVTPVPLSTTTPSVVTESPANTATDTDDKAAIAITTVGAAAADQNVKPLLQDQYPLKQEYNELELAQQEQHRKEKVIELVLRQANIHKVSRRLRSRLQFAILKIRRGWSKYTLQEVESLVQSSPTSRVAIPPSFSSISSQSPSPPPSSSKKGKQPLPEKKERSSSASSTSPTRQSGRKRVPRVYPDYEAHADLYPSQQGDDQDAEEDRSTTEPVRRRSRRLSQSAALAAAAENLKDESGGSSKKRKGRGGRPSYSEFKDSELFSPAQSLMEIATSAPGSPVLTTYHPAQYERQPYSPYGYGSSGPLYRDEYASPYSASAPNSPRMDVNRIKEDTPSDAQAAETILLLASSPTRSAPRALNPAYLQSQHRSHHHHPGHHHHQRSDQPQRGLTASPVMHHAELPYSPSTSSPLVQFPAVVSRQSSPVGDDDDDEDNPFMPASKKSSARAASGPKTSGSSKKKESLASLYGKKKDVPPEEQKLASTHRPSSRRTSITSQFGLSRTESGSKDTVASSSFARAVTPTSPNPPSLPPQTPTTRRASLRMSSSTEYGIQTPPPSMNKELNAPPPAQLISSFSGPRAGSPTPSGSKTADSSIKTRRMSTGLAGGPSAAVDAKDNPQSRTTDLRDIFPVHPSRSTSVASTTGSNSSSPVVRHR
ncbi:hypothetical protein EMPS_05052 [Entomortierella parvispora]|uniref:Uncharacterized protein n=1 Tax=Entomortierella parvispora TaxID=205924 RepID=A0A9P3H9R4_9FUNG|nr:hypothetical protein EMPS_05052 [Entomortierella parvispora]